MSAGDTRTDRQIIAAAAALCRAEDAAQTEDTRGTDQFGRDVVQPSTTGAESAQQAGTRETLELALGRIPTSSDWQVFVEQYD